MQVDAMMEVDDNVTGFSARASNSVCTVSKARPSSGPQVFSAGWYHVSVFNTQVPPSCVVSKCLDTRRLRVLFVSKREIGNSVHCGVAVGYMHF